MTDAMIASVLQHNFKRSEHVIFSWNESRQLADVGGNIIVASVTFTVFFQVSLTSCVILQTSCFRVNVWQHDFDT